MDTSTVDNFLNSFEEYNDTFDVIFIDGLHEAMQTYIDVRHH